MLNNGGAFSGGLLTVANCIPDDDRVKIQSFEKIRTSSPLNGGEPVSNVIASDNTDVAYRKLIQNVTDWEDRDSHLGNLGIFGLAATSFADEFHIQNVFLSNYSTVWTLIYVQLVGKIVIKFYQLVILEAKLT